MPEVFINYRTGDGDMAATLIDRELSRRFGEDSSFRASKSIRPGTPYAEELLRNVRRCSLLFAVIGPEWTSFPDLHNGQGWVRREILEALAGGIPVVPVILGRLTSRLSGSDLPPELARLADFQSLRLDTQNAPADLKRIGDLTSDMVPSLADSERAAERSSHTEPVSDSVNNTASDVQGTVIQGRDISGDVGTVVKNSSGPVHTGKGNIYENSRHQTGGRHYSGDGMTNFEGDNSGGVNNHFGERRRDEDDER